MRTLSVAALAAIALLGCASPAEQQARLDRDVNDLIRAHGPVCERQGYAGDSAQWRNCVYQSARQEYTSSQGAEWNFPLTHRLGQKLGLIRS